MYENNTNRNLHFEEQSTVWCSCENQSINHNEIECDYCIWKRFYKTERYDIYNEFWKEHFIEMGRILVSRNKEDKERFLCQQAYRFIKPDSSSEKFENVIPDDIRILTILGNKDKKIIIPKKDIPIIKHTGPWSSLFKKSETAISPD